MTWNGKMNMVNINGMPKSANGIAQKNCFRSFVNGATSQLNWPMKCPKMKKNNIINFLLGIVFFINISNIDMKISGNITMKQNGVEAKRFTIPNKKE